MLFGKRKFYCRTLYNLELRNLCQLHRVVCADVYLHTCIIGMILNYNKKKRQLISFFWKLKLIFWSKIKKYKNETSEFVCRSYTAWYARTCPSRAMPAPGSAVAATSPSTSPVPAPLPWCRAPMPSSGVR